MVFKPTQGRQYYSKEYGVIDISGQVAMAKAVQGFASDVTQASFKVANKVADDNYNQAVRQAEADGKTNAVVRNQQTGEIEPFVNLDYTKANDGFMTDAQRDSVKQVWRDAAFQTYASSVGNDAVADANRVFIENKTDPDAIRGALNGKLESLQETLDPTLFALVEPKITAAYKAAENKAFAGQQIATNERANVENSTAFYHNVDQIGILSSALTGDEVKDRPALDRISELREENEAIRDSLEVHEFGAANIAKLNVAEATIVAEKMSTTVAEKIYKDSENGGLVAAINAAHAAEDQFANNPDVDGEKIKKLMLAHVAGLKFVDDAKNSEAAKADKELSDELELAIRTDVTKVNLEDIIKSNISDDGIKATLINIHSNELAGAQKSVKEKQKLLRDSYKDKFDKLYNVFIDESLPQSERNSAESQIRAMNDNLLVEPAEWRTFTKANNKVVSKSLKESGVAMMSTIDMQMSKSNGYKTHPSVFKQMEGQLIAEGVVGEGRAVTLKEWRSKVETYTNNFATADKKRRNTMSAMTKASNGMKLSEKDRSLLVQAADVVFERDPANESIFFHSDPQVKDENFSKAIKFSMKYKMIHPEMVNAINSLHNSIADEESFNTSISYFNKLYQSMFTNMSNEGVYANPSMRLESMLSDAGINVTDFSYARKVGYKKWQASQGLQTEVTSGGRVARSFDAVFGDIGSAINSNIGKAIEGSSIGESLLNNTFWDSERDPRALGIIDQLLDSAPGGASVDESDLIVKDSRLSEYLRRTVPVIMQENRMEMNEQSLQIAIRNAVVAVSKDIGITFDEDGTPSLGFNTWYKQASASIGANADVIEGGVEGSFFREVRRHALRPDVAIDDSLREMIQNGEGVIKVYPDDFYGDEQTYTIFLQTEEGENKKILSGFNYHYERSLDYAVNQVAVNRVENTTFKKFLSHYDLIKPYVLRGVHESILEDYNNDADLIGLGQPEKFIGALEMLNGALNSVKPVAGFFTGKSYAIDPQVDAEDVKVLRAYLNGDFASEKLFNKALQESLDE